MKELTTEQKAQRYDEAIKRAKDLLGIGVKDTRDKMVVLSFFPELKESEDERIRKELISLFQDCIDGVNHRYTGSDSRRWLAWLEKQGKQKPAGWSKEDKDYYDAIIAKLEVTQDDALLTDNQMEFLKSLKDRVQPQNTWKPSDEQMDALRYVTNFDYGGHKAILVSLYEQLKKLRKE